MLAGLDIILIFISVVCGAGIGYYIRKQRALQATNSAEAKAEKIVTEAKAKEKELLIKAQEKAIATIDEAKKEDVVLLIYGSPLSATTHISLINACKSKNVKYQILHSGSVFDAVAESGLSLYKFGKTASLPKWQKNFNPKSFMEIIKDNQKIEAHSLLLIDIGLSFNDCKKQLEESDLKGKVIVCSRLGVRSKFYYDSLEKIPAEKVKAPYCIIVLGKLDDYEEESLAKI